jgi:PhzF family phenazine biosynthesis protein
MKIFQVDAFTSRPFSGNPAGVCLLDGPVSDGWMQGLAAELNLSETAFLVGRTEGFAIRFFTPLVEVPLCGHATLAAAHIVWQENLAAGAGPLTFTCPLGPLRATREGDWICLDFPADPAVAIPVPRGLNKALGVPLRNAWRTRLNYLLVETELDALRAMKPDMSGLANGRYGPVGVTAAGGEPGVDFVSRFFAPGVGIPEDPVTGSSHCSLGPLWAQRLGKPELRALQLSARGGELRVRVRGDRVDLLGQAVTVFGGELAPSANPA